MKLSTRELTIFSMLGALMYASKILMEVAPNIHLLSMLTIVFTVVYRKKALYPIYTFVLLNGVFSGFSTWWIPYLYIWTVLWGAIRYVCPGNAEPVHALWLHRCCLCPVYCRWSPHTSSLRAFLLHSLYTSRC